MMGNWGDDVDYEAKELKEYKARFTINFKKIFMYVGEVSERTLEVTDKHPKDSLLTLWAGVLLGLFPFFLLSYQVLMIVTLPLIVFYFIALLRVYKCWVSFKYSGFKFWLMTVPALVLDLAAALGAQYLIVSNFLAK